jgi:hypothetical protein
MSPCMVDIYIHFVSLLDDPVAYGCCGMRTCRLECAQNKHTHYAHVVLRVVVVACDAWKLRTHVNASRAVLCATWNFSCFLRAMVLT